MLFKIVQFEFKTFIPPNFSLVEAHLKFLFWYGTKLCISSNLTAEINFWSRKEVKSQGTTTLPDLFLYFLFYTYYYYISFQSSDEFATQHKKLLFIGIRKWVLYIYIYIYIHIYTCVWVCVCVWEREREKENVCVCVCVWIVIFVNQKEFCLNKKSH